MLSLYVKNEGEPDTYADFRLVSVGIGNVEKNSVEISDDDIDRLGFIPGQSIFDFDSQSVFDNLVVDFQ